ncbi:MAG: SRPBCC family protein [Parasphingorhabdus sp.]|jgi:uncharacterized protein YndB with AHSA1/START domain|nr:SRPBCC family protein [Parasphingorhabdus sp.]|tara:strand:- start:227 stop:700 length:474 start_codon:yes stop_codon:yes gene_type:complete
MMNKKPNLLLAEHKLLIDSPVERVFDFLANHENYARWYPNVLSVVSGNPLPHGQVGKFYEEAIRLPTRRVQKIRIAVVESRPPELFVTEGEFPPLHPRMEVRLSPQPSGATLLHWQFFSRSQSAIGRRMIPLLLGKNLLRDTRTGLARMKSMVEDER